MSVFLDTVSIVSVAIILVICVEMAQTSITDWKTTVIAITGFTVTLKFKNMNSAFIIIGGSLFGYLLSLI